MNLKFNYKGYYGSCQTFCVKLVQEVDDLILLNLEANFGNLKKSKLAKWLSDLRKALNLIKLMNERFAINSSFIGMELMIYDESDFNDVCTDPGYLNMIRKYVQ